MTRRWLGDPWNTPMSDLVGRARNLSAWESLDAALIERVLSALLEQREPLPRLRDGLEDALNAASDAPPALRERWMTLLDLTLKAADRPSTAALMDAALVPGGRAGEVLALLANDDRTWKLQELRERMNLSDQRIGQLVDQLEALHVARRLRVGREVAVHLTPHGQRLGAYVVSSSTPAPLSRPVVRNEASPRIASWNLGQRTPLAQLNRSL